MEAMSEPEPKSTANTRAKCVPWYEAGLAFSCQQCGRCCAGPEEGYIWITKDEMARAADVLGLTAEQFRRRYTARVGVRYTIVEKRPSNDCIFLTRSSQGCVGCDIYQARPLQCRTWPFWPENLSSARTWERAAQTCPGMNQGQWFNAEQIDAIRQGRLDGPAPRQTASNVAWQWISEHREDQSCLDALGGLYANLDNRLAAASPSCRNCGSCCNFQEFDHRLYVTTLEMLHFVTSLKESGVDGATRRLLRPKKGACPYLGRTGCTARDGRPTGCRIFYCTGLDQAFQAETSEQTLDTLRRLHQQLRVPYYYADLLEWLNNAPAS